MKSDSCYDAIISQGIKTSLILFVLVFLCLSISQESLAKNNGAPLDATTTLKAKSSKMLDEVTQRITILEKSEALDTTQKSELSWLRQVRDFLQKTITSADRTHDFYQVAQGIPARLKRIEDELATQLPVEPNVDDRQPMSTLEGKLESAWEALETARRVRNEIEAEANQRSDRLQRIADESSSARKRREELSQLLAVSSVVDSDKALEAKRNAALAEQDYLNQLLQELEYESRSYESRRELLRARRQQVERQVLIAEQHYNALDQIVNQLRTNAASQAMLTADSASLASANAHPLVHAIANENKILATELQQISALNASLSMYRKELEETLNVLRRKFDGIKEKVAQVGLTDAIGLKLRSDRNQLPDISYYSSSIKERHIEVNRTQLRRIEIEDRLFELIDLTRESSNLIDNDPTPVSENKRIALESVVHDALKEQKENYLNELLKAYDIYFEKNLLPIMEGERELITLADDYDEFIDTRILWIQSAPTLELKDFQRLGAAIVWALNPSSIRQVISGLGSDLKNNPLSVITPLIVFILLLANYRRLKTKLSELGRYVTKLSKAKFTDTLLATIITILMVLPWPLLLYVIGQRLAQISVGQGYSAALSSGFIAVSYLIFSGLLLRRMCRKDGLGEAHFRWKSEHMNLVRSQLNWYLLAALPLVFTIAFTLNQPTQAHHDSLGRVAFIVLMMLSALLVYRLLRPSTGLLKFTLENNPDGWLDRLAGIWFPVLVLTPISLAVASVVGYFYTALQLSLLIVSTISLLFVCSILRALLIRGLNIAHRKLALEQWRRKATTHDGNLEAEMKAQSGESTDPAISEEAVVNVMDLSVQTMKLINSVYWVAIAVGLTWIWAEVLPALNIFNEVVLWSSEVVSSESGTATQDATTLSNLLMAIVILIMTFFIGHNIPGLLEIAILQRLPFTPSGRYAITSIARYILIIIGLAMTFSAIGIGWSKVQWLAAAITVGLGFGLQEIFANFVSGLIILFERQIRVGDAVTVGTISGKVSRIQMRATTITDWDRKELIIPNKEFVTGQVVNWSLSDTILRLLIPVGIAYGSDTRLAYDLLLAAAHEHHNVLDDPESSVRFGAFGESSLNFELRIYIPHPDLLLETRHELLMDIDQRFREAKIEIAFPQRDIHIRDYPRSGSAAI